MKLRWSTYKMQDKPYYPTTMKLQIKAGRPSPKHIVKQSNWDFQFIGLPLETWIKDFHVILLYQF